MLDLNKVVQELRELEEMVNNKQTVFTQFHLSTRLKAMRISFELEAKLQAAEAREKKEYNER